MPHVWTAEEEERNRKQLVHLYIDKNLSIKEIGNLLTLSEKTIYKRLRRLNIPTNPTAKPKYQNKRSDVFLPKEKTNELAELFGILLGDGHITHFQTTVTLGNKELDYAKHVQKLLLFNFGGQPKICIRRNEYSIVYLGSVAVTQWLFNNGMVTNKVRDQVTVPKWIFDSKTYMKSFLRGFFDTDGSVYAIHHGAQLSLTNHSKPLLESLQQLLLCLEYSPSRISGNKLYITRKNEVERFFVNIQPKNLKHIERYKSFKKCVGTQAVNEDRL